MSSSNENPLSISVECIDERASGAFAARLAPLLGDVSLFTLEGDLGAGKTTFVRALLAAMGYEGRVKSPTYALVEPYEIEGREVFHFDLYRLSDPEELDFLGLDDYFTGQSLCLVEWADKGEGMLPTADLKLSIDFAGSGRVLTLRPSSPEGASVIATLGS